MKPVTALAYLAGVLHGDAWLTKELGLRVADRDFADAFAAALRDAFGLERVPRRDERGYWILRLGNASGRFNILRAVAPVTAEDRGAWVRGLFDSEGNANIHRVRGGEHCWGRRIAMYSTALDTLHTAAAHLTELGITTLLRATKNSAGHKGTKVVHELSLRGSRDNYARFASTVGSSIARKRDTMTAIVESYKPDLSAHCREVQLLGAATKLKRTLETVVPAVIAAIHARIDAGEKVTMRECEGAIAGYRSARNHFTHKQLVAAARSGATSVA